MTLPVLNQSTTATVELQPYFALDGRPVVITIIKQRFVVRANGRRLERVPDAPVHLVDVPWDEDADGPVTARHPAEGGLAKVGTDVVVVGSATLPAGRPAPQIDVSVRVGPVQKQLRVFGPRRWTQRLMGVRPSEPDAFEALPLRWEDAYGGSCMADPDKPVFETRNPLGRGVTSDPETLLGRPVPRIEDPRDPIRTGASRPAPAGVAAIGSDFEPRVGYAGTFDQRWQDERMPLLPLDFDPRHNQVATPDLVCPGFLRGGEPVELVNLHPRGPVVFALPKLAFHVGSSSRQGDAVHRAVLDLVSIEPMTSTLDLVWRAVVPSATGRRAVRAIQVHEKRFV